MRQSFLYLFTVAAAGGGAWFGWWAFASARVNAWVAAAVLGEGEPEVCRLSNHRARRSGWAAASGAAAGTVFWATAAADQIPASSASDVASAALASWAAILALAAIVDIERLVLPTPLVRLAALASAAALVLSVARTSGPAQVFQVSCVLALTAIGYGTWWLSCPLGVGLGDVRMACATAIGAGACSAPTALVALSCAPLAAGLVGQLGLARTLRRPVPLGPFLAFGGVLTAVSHAI